MPVAVTWNVPPVLLITLVLFALVICGACVTVNVKVCRVEPTKFSAATVKVYMPAGTVGDI